MMYCLPIATRWGPEMTATKNSCLWIINATQSDHGESTTIATEDGFCVAVIGSPAWDDTATLDYPQDRENARLIAQAPDMELILWALVHVNADYGYGGWAFDIGPDDGPVTETVEFAADENGLPDFTHPGWPAAREALMRHRAALAAEAA